MRNKGGETLGQKVHPISFRLGYIKTWDSRWYAGKDYSQLLIEDLRIREYLKKKLYHAGVAKIEIERVASKAKKAKVTIHTARPGIIIGKKGAEVDNLKKELQKMTQKEIFVSIQEVKRAESRCPAGCGECGPPNGTTDWVSESHEEGRDFNHEAWGQGNKDPLRGTTGRG
jgi:hypothetical protein